MSRVCLTIDLDFTNYVDGVHRDDFEQAFPIFQRVLSQRADIATTWFVRVDSQIEALHGAADHFLHRHAEKFSWLREHGHEIGWHFHAYRREGGEWIQNTDEEVICDELFRYAPLALPHVTGCVRMGWGFHTNATMQAVDELGFKVDSSAIPRPQYRWERSVKDWRTTGQAAYYPSSHDYRIAGEPRRRILEVPINTVALAADTDTEPGVLRYLDPAYFRDAFAQGMRDHLSRHDTLVLVCHPYELLPGSATKSGLLAFDPDAFEANVLSLPHSLTLSQLSERSAG